jgi:hypothetical protein
MTPTFEIIINGKRITRARVNSGLGTLSTLLTWSGRGRKSGTTFYVGGIELKKNVYVNWIREAPVKTGDKITIRITANKRTNNPVSTEPVEKKSDLQAKIDYYHQLKKELKKGGHI